MSLSFPFFVNHRILWEAQFNMVLEFWARVEKNEQNGIIVHDT
jgi:hypothetical protein